MAIGKALSVGIIGLETFTIHIQSCISQGLPFFSIIGLPDTSLSEARDRVKSACQSTGFSWPQTRVTVNLSPASMPKRGSSHDLAIAVSILCAARVIPDEQIGNTIVLGELNLDGTILPIHGILPILLHARNHNITRVVVPYANRHEAQLVPDIDIISVQHIGELIEYFGGKAHYQLPQLEYDTHSPQPHIDYGDMSQVIGQDYAIYAMQIAAAGKHHMLMVGPPGAGKTMLASRMPTIMPPLQQQAQLEVASIRSLCGTLEDYGISDVAPYEAPHHTASTASLVGGGTGIAQPGSISKAHHGILFMDEAPEFTTRTLQTLREPLESGKIVLSRSKGSVTYPADFQLIMAANPCPCGMWYGTGERCVCTTRKRQRYLMKLSGPILDRIDIQIHIPAVEQVGANASSGPSSATLKEDVIQAQERARHRYKQWGWQYNAQVSGQWLHENTPYDALEIANESLRTHTLTLRGADRALRLAWTLADLAQHPAPTREDMFQGIALRTTLS